MSLTKEQLLDLEVGIWIKDGVYYFQGNKREWVNVTDRFLSCMKHRWFSQGNIKNAVTYMQGRKYYGFGKPIMDPKVIVGSSGNLATVTYKNLERIRGRKWSLSHIICGSFGKDPITDLIMSKCTDVGALISRSLIRTAATRIFNEPEQSIMELPVNSVDAYFPERSVGKFGMGFFSILYWLVGTKRKLHITSFCLDDQKRSYAYKVTIFYENELVFVIDPIISYTNITGTCMEIDASGQEFSQDTLEKFKSFLGRLFYVKGVTIGKSQDDFKFIYVDVTSKSVKIEDYATGISLNTLLTKLFIPSVSSKTIQSSQKIGDKKLVQELSRESLTLNILVNDISIVVVSKKAETMQSGFLWRLPSNTKVPVSRDDIFLEPKSAEETLGELIDLAIANKVFIDLQKLFLEYFSDTKIRANISIIQNIFDKKVAQHSKILVPENEGLKYFIPNSVQSLTFNTDVVKTSLIESLNANDRVKYLGSLFYGKKVFAVKNLPAKVCDVYFIDILVVSEEITRKQGWEYQLSLTNFRQGKLLPKSSQEPSFLDKYDTSKLSKKAKNLINSIAGLLIGYKSIHGSLSIHEEVDISLCIKLYELCGKHSYVVFNALSQALKNFVPSQSYGQQYFSLFRRIDISSRASFPENEKFYRLVAQMMVDELKLSLRYKSTTWIFTPLTTSHLKTVEDYKVFDFVVNRVDSHIYLEYIISILGITNYKLDEVKTFFDILYRKVRIRNPSLEELRDHNYFESTLSPEDAALIDFAKNLLSEGGSKIPVKDFVPISGSKISNVKLINYLFDNPQKLTFDDFSKIETWVSQRDIKLQILEIAVNEGTTKPFIEASITECFQNSVDAIRKFNPEVRSIDFEVYKCRDHMVLSISDHVGMNIESFLYISVPFLSTKSDKDPAYTGEMGTGFFNVYRESSMVRILTRPPDSKKTYVWEDIPVRREGRVVDINKTFSTTDFLRSRGTRIEIYIPYSEKPSTDPMVKDFSHMAETMELITKRFCVTPLNINITFNGNDITRRCQRITTKGKFEFYLVPQELKKEKIEFMSFVYTNGVPFALFTEKYSHAPEIVTQVVVNVLPGGYIPRQSRAYLDFGDNKPDYDFLSDIIKTYMAMYKTMNYPGTSYFDPTYLDTSEMDSVLPKKGGESRPRTLYFKFPGYPSVAETILEAAKICNLSCVDDEAKTKLVLWLDANFSSDDPIGDLIKMYVFSWAVVKVPVSKEIGEKKKEDEKKAKKEPSLSLFVELYVKIAQELGIKGFESVKPEAFSLHGEGRSYTRKNQIFIYGASEPEVLEAFSKGMAYYSILSDGIWFETYRPIGSVTHELEHVRRHETVENDADSAHSPIDYALWEGDVPHERSFDQCVFDIYTKIAEKGLWSRFDSRFSRM